MSEPAVAHSEGSGHIANWVSWLAQALGGHETLAGRLLHQYEDLVFAAIIAGFICLFAWLASRRFQQIPRGLQNFVETIVESLNAFTEEIIGPEGRRYAPFIGTLFIYILSMNLAGLLIPGFKSPTASLNTTAGLALCVFIYVQCIGLKSYGLKGYVVHMMGSPESGLMAVIGLLILFIELIGEFVKPVSLAMRLAFNITGEDSFLGAAVSFGVLGLPLQLMAMGLGLILSTAQALVFSTLTAVFIGMKLHHSEEHSVGTVKTTHR